MFVLFLLDALYPHKTVDKKQLAVMCLVVLEPASRLSRVQINLGLGNGSSGLRVGIGLKRN